VDAEEVEEGANARKVPIRNRVIVMTKTFARSPMMMTDRQVVPVREDAAVEDGAVTSVTIGIAMTMLAANQPSGK
jgi:hypothetical protein